MRVPRERTSRTPLSMILGLMAALLLCACGGGNGGAGATDATETAQSKGGTRGAPTTTTTVDNTATLDWSVPQTNADGSALSDLAGFRIYYGTASGNYTQTVTVSDAATLTYTIQNLSAGTYYMVVKAFDTSNNESTASVEVSKTIR